MSAIDFVSKNLSWLPKPIARFFEKKMKTLPKMKKMINNENEKIAASLEKSLKPYADKFEKYNVLPATGIEKEKVLASIQEMINIESSKWQDGYVSGGIYHGAQEHIDFLNKVYALNSQSNPLHADIFPSNSKYESEIVAMVASFMGQGKTTDDSKIVGCVSSGGTESILLAMKTYRDQAFEEKGITQPEMIVPTSVHVAFDKAAHYFGIKQIKIDVKDDFTVDVDAVKKAITKNTIVIVGSAPCFPHGVIDDIPTLSEIAYEQGIGFHTDACLGGFIVPFAEKLGYPVPIIDFRLRGVTSVSIDTHKYGYAAKGTSVVLYRNEKLRHYQYFTATEWPGGLYFSPTLAGSRNGGLSAACWATLLTMGEDGYLRATKAILEAAQYVKTAIKKEIPDLQILGNPLWVIAIKSDTLNIYEVLDYMSHKGWSLNGLHKPSCFHLAFTLRQTLPDVPGRFISDLKEAVIFVKENPGKEDGMAPIYGMAATLPFRGLVSDILKKYMDIIYKV